MDGRIVVLKVSKLYVPISIRLSRTDSVHVHREVFSNSTVLLTAVSFVYNLEAIFLF
jgi:hypothetical protein